MQNHSRLYPLVDKVRHHSYSWRYSQSSTEYNILQTLTRQPCLNCVVPLLPDHWHGTKQGQTSHNPPTEITNQPHLTLKCHFLFTHQGPVTFPELYHSHTQHRVSFLLLPFSEYLQYLLVWDNCVHSVNQQRDNGCISLRCEIISTMKCTVVLSKHSEWACCKTSSWSSCTALC